MPEITLESLKKLWKADKEKYRTEELGSGIQRFCKEVLTCVSLFGLSEGNASTKETNRKNEFLHEKKKERRRADFVIFIDSDIIIPVEAECYGNINAGIKQLYNYQSDWVKKLGILTDGNEWRFYNNNYVEKTFFIDKLLEDPSDFITYWKEYIKPEHYYSTFFEKKGQQKLFEPDIPHLDDVREDFFKGITVLIECIKNKFNLKGYFEEVQDDKEKEKKATEITYAYLIQFVLYKTLVDNAFADFEEDWKLRLETINNGLNTKSYGEILRRIQGISNKISKNIYRRFSDEQDFINKRLKEILDKPKNEINDVSVWLDIILFINRFNFSNVRNEIFGYVYENYLKTFYSDEQKGQYFTDPDVAEFMLDAVGYEPSELKERYDYNKDSISIIDPSCGSGTFLYDATRRIVDTFFIDTPEGSSLVERLVNQNIFGVDIAVFPLYLAEMSILMRLLPIIVNQKYNNPIDQKIKVFETQDSISEFLNTAIVNTKTDNSILLSKAHGQLSMFVDDSLGYKGFMRDKTDLDELKKSLENGKKIQRYRFDYVVGNPPYIGYNECSKQGIGFTQLIQCKELLMSNIYGVNLNTVPGRIKAYAPKPNLYTFFIALGLALLKDKGKLCYIIPQTLLTSTDHDVMRFHLAKYMTIEKIYTFSGRMFIGRGIKQNKPIATSSLIIVIKKSEPTKDHIVEILNLTSETKDIEECLKNIRDDVNVFHKSIAQSQLFKHIENWSHIKFDNTDEKIFSDYNKCDLFDIYRLEKHSKKKFGELFYFDKGLIYKPNTILSNPPSVKYFEIIKKNQKGFLIKVDHSYISRNSITFPKGAQGFKVYDTKYKIIWRYMNTENFMFCEKNVMINHNWVLISSNNRREILYIFSILNSIITKFVLWKLFGNENEKSFQIGIKVIKEFCRVPCISGENQRIKDEIIAKTEELINLENQHLSDYVLLREVMIQKFESIQVHNDHLQLKYKGNIVQCKILKDRRIVEKTIKSEYGDLGLQSGSMSDLKMLPITDRDRQESLKKYIDDLIYALYFNVHLEHIGIENQEQISKTVSKYGNYQHIYNCVSKTDIFEV